MCVCLNVFVLFVNYCAMLYGLGVVDCLCSIRVRAFFTVCALFKCYCVVLYVCLHD